MYSALSRAHQMPGHAHPPAAAPTPAHLGASAAGAPKMPFWYCLARLGSSFSSKPAGMLALLASSHGGGAPQARGQHQRLAQQLLHLRPRTAGWVAWVWEGATVEDWGRGTMGRGAAPPGIYMPPGSAGGRVAPYCLRASVAYRSVAVA